MTKRTGFFLLIVFIALTGHAQKFVLNSDWRDSTIVIDGSPVDWAVPFRFFDSKSKLQYDVVNDNKYIYVSVRTNDEKAQMKIMRAGMDVWFDVSGKRKEISTVHFPLKNNPKLDTNPDPDDAEHQVVEKPDVKKMQMDWAESGREVRVQGFKNVPERFSMLDTVKQSIQAAINWERDNTLTYELKVPFSAFYNKDVLVGADSTRTITIGIRANAMDLPLMPTNANSDMTGLASAPMAPTTNGMPNNVNNNQRPQTAMPQPTMAIPKNVADMGVALVVTMKIRLSAR